MRIFLTVFRASRSGMISSVNACELRRLAEEVGLVRRDQVEDLVELRVGARVVLEEVEVLLERVEVQLARARREPLLQQVLRRVVEPHAGAFVDLRPAAAGTRRPAARGGGSTRSIEWQMRHGCGSSAGPPRTALSLFFRFIAAESRRSPLPSGCRPCATPPRAGRDRDRCGGRRRPTTSSRMAAFSSALNRCGNDERSGTLSSARTADCCTYVSGSSSARCSAGSARAIAADAERRGSGGAEAPVVVRQRDHQAARRRRRPGCAPAPASRRGGSPGRTRRRQWNSTSLTRRVAPTCRAPRSTAMRTGGRSCIRCRISGSIASGCRYSPSACAAAVRIQMS